MTIPTVPSLEVPESFVPWLESRGLIYQLLADFYGRKPSLSMIAQWSRNRRLAQAVELTEGGRELCRYLCEQPGEELKRISERELPEYARLMSERQVSLPLREAVQLGRGEAFSNIVAEVYTSAGVVFKKCNGESDDHIALELEFMAVLHERMLYNSYTVRSAAELLAVQERFLDEHLLQWTPLFCERLNAATDSPLYLSLSHLLEEFLPQDLLMLRSWKSWLESCPAETTGIGIS